MIFGMTMVKVRPGQESTAYLAIQAIKGIKETYRIFGEFSFFLIMEAFSSTELDRVAEEIGMIEEVVEIRPILVTANRELSEPVLSESAEFAVG
jgi:hypothetical protein